jgi:hypothetical protein
MSSDPKAELLKVSSARDIDPCMVDAASSIEAKILLTLTEHSNLQAQTNYRFFQKLDQASAAAAQAVEAATAAKVQNERILERLARQDEDAAETKQTNQRIDKATQETNGKVKKLRSEMDQTIEERKLLMREREKKILEAEAARLRKEGLMVLPRQIGTIAKWLWSHFMTLLKALGAIALAWPILEWFWQHRPFFGH